MPVSGANDLSWRFFFWLMEMQVPRWRKRHWFQVAIRSNLINDNDSYFDVQAVWAEPLSPPRHPVRWISWAGYQAAAASWPRRGQSGLGDALAAPWHSGSCTGRNLYGWPDRFRRPREEACCPRRRGNSKGQVHVRAGRPDCRSQLRRCLSLAAATDAGKRAASRFRPVAPGKPDFGLYQKVRIVTICFQGRIVGIGFPFRHSG